MNRFIEKSRADSPADVLKQMVEPYAAIMKKNYNYTRRKLYLPEYGRHIQEMIDSLMEIEDRHERNRQARAVIAVMGNLNPLLRDTADFTHKLWDHLFIMSDFQLDVDSPYPRPTRLPPPAGAPPCPGAWAF